MAICASSCCLQHQYKCIHFVEGHHHGLNFPSQTGSPCIDFHQQVPILMLHFFRNEYEYCIHYLQSSEHCLDQ